MLNWQVNRDCTKPLGTRSPHCSLLCALGIWESAGKGLYWIHISSVLLASTSLPRVFSGIFTEANTVAGELEEVKDDSMRQDLFSDTD